MAEFEFTIKDEQAQAMLAQLVAKAEDTTPMLNLVGGALKSRVLRQFDKQQDPYGNPWKALKLRAGQILRDTGALRNSIDYEIDGDAAVVIGTKIPYAIVHQTGAHIVAGKPPHLSLGGYHTKGSPVLRWAVGGQTYVAKEVTIPKRPFLPTELGGLPEDWSAEITNTLIDYLGLE